MKNYAEFYNKLTKTFQDKPAAIRSLQVINSLLTKVMYLVYPLLLIHLFINTPDKLPIFILIPGLSFILVSLGRHLLNTPRPYETWNITPLISKDTKGHSFPSRHVFSASIISMAVLTQSSFLGVILLILSLIIAFCRVLGGVHYPHDVVAGYLIGLICGFLLFLF